MYKRYANIIASVVKARKAKTTLIGLIFLNNNSQLAANRVAKFKQELELVRKLGYGVDWGEQAESIVCFGAPVLDYRGLPKAAIWITGPEFRLSAEKVPVVGETVKKYAKELSARLGG